MGITDFFSNEGFMPHIHCYLDKPSLVWTMVATDSLIGLAYLGISITLWALVRKINIPFSMVVLCFGIFIAACGGTHFMEVYNLWVPNYWAAAGVKAVTAVASVGTGVYLFQLRHPLVNVAEAAKLSEQRRLDLEALTTTLEQRVSERTAALEKAVNVREEFFSIASHELRTPLTSLKMKSQMAKRGIGLKLTDDTSKKFVWEMDLQIDRLVKLVDDMLDISRHRGGRLSVNAKQDDLSETVSSTFERIRPQMVGAGIEPSLKVEPHIHGIFDRLRIEQVISNLLSNAIKYAPGAPLSLTLSKSQNSAKIEVEDNGPGIASEHHERIFQRFERLSSLNTSGLGVGLFLSRALVEAHGGSLSLYSETGKGARFVVQLPLKSPSLN